jgi:hypothetical protein
MKYTIRCFFVLVFQVLPITGFTQYKKVTHVFFRTIGNKIEIFYDLPKNSDTLDVTIYFRKKSDPKMRYRLKWASGSIGVGRYSETKQKIVWNFKKVPPYLFTGSGFHYEIKAKKIYCNKKYDFQRYSRSSKIGITDSK